jgi:hypothetical protein
MARRLAAELCASLFTRVEPATPKGGVCLDAVQTHTGIGQVVFQHAVAQIGRYPRQHEEHSYPSERYPFNFAAIPESVHRKNDGVNEAARHGSVTLCTVTLRANTGSGTAPMTHTDPRDGSDAPIPSNVRDVHACRSPHAAIAADNPKWVGQLPPSNFSPQPFLRACFVTDDRWASQVFRRRPNRVAAARRRPIDHTRRRR